MSHVFFCKEELMKYWYILLATFSLLALSEHISAQTINPNCFDPSHPDYRSTRCVIQRLEGDDGNGNLFNCSDGVDNDGDGLTDCEEPSCNCTAPTTETNCGDGVDNDGDGLIDCQDRDDCGGSVLCENDCGDGVDNDGDGFFDYYDGDCLADPDNPNSYIVTQPDCESVPLGNVFSIQAADSSANRTSAAMGMPMVADVDNDGTPEVITTNGQNGMIYILDGSDLSVIENQRDFGPSTRGYPVVADVDDDGFGEIFIVGGDNRIKAYQHDLTDYWTANSTGFNDGRIANIADFNLDGVPELYQVNEIRDATTGTVLIAGSHGTGTYPSANSWRNDLNAAPVAVNMFPDAFCADCDGLELVVGHIIYSVDLENDGDGMHLTEVANMDDAANLPADYRGGGYHPKHSGFGNQTWSTTSVVDFNNDGFLDVIMGGTTGNQDGPTSVFFWDIQNSAVRMYVVARPGNTITANRGNFRDLSGGGCDNTNELCTWRRGLGTVNIANIDGDPELEITFMSGSSLYALDQNLNVEWENHDQFWESSSGFTGTTIFDFDGDGASEVIYRDEINLYIVDGVSGRIINGYLDGSFCSSQTQGEYPIVADVDGDGETEIILSCGRERNVYGQSPATSGTRENGHIKVYKAANDNYWVPARRIWNQFSYFNVNINDDLSVPTFAQPHHISFSQLCNDPNAANLFSLNKFLNQSPRISFCGNLVFPAAKLDFVGDSTRIIPPECPNQEFQIRLYFENNGDEEVGRPIPISFYSDNPEQAYADTDQDPHFAVVEIDIPGGLQPGDFVDTLLTVAGPRGNYTVYASLNDIGPYDDLGNKIDNSAFYPLTTLNGPVRECDDTPTIVSTDVNPSPFSVQVNKIQDNRNCPGAIATDNNGEAQVRAADGSALPVSEYNFTWTNIADGSIVSTSPIATELDSGTYEIVAVYDNGVFTCQGIADTVRIERLEDWPTADTVTIEIVQPVSSCDPGTADGHLRVLLDGIAPDLTNYSVYWTDEQEGDTLAIGAEATNLVPLLYKVVVNNLLTGCSETVTYDLTLDIPQIDTLTTTDNTNCKNPNGTITVKVDGSAAAYDYMLIQLSPLQDTVFSSNPSFNDLDEGIYEVRAYDPTNNCGLYTQGEEVEIITTKTIDAITIQVAQEQTACSFPYNGQLTAVLASGSNFSKYDWTWYRGTVTTGPSAEIIGNDYITPDTLSTNLTSVYTVVAVETSSGCTFSESIVLTDNIVIPAINPTDVNVLQHQTTCEPNGQVQVTVGGLASGYQFTLQQGSTVIESNFTGLFTSLEAGPYFVISEDTATRCVSNPSAIFRIDNQIIPFGAIAITQTPQTNCTPTNSNGALSATVGGTTAGFTFKWFVGVDTASAYSPQPATPSQLTGIAADNYVLSIYNQNTGCDTLIYTSVVDESADYLETIIATKLDDQRFCTPGVFSGSIEADLLPSTSGSAPDTAIYTYYWYQGTKNDVRNGLPSIAGQNRSVITGLDVGWHSVRAVRNDGSDCAALDTAEVFIQDVRDFPVAGINVDIISQTSCDAMNQNGGLQGDVNGNTVGYVFTWYQLVSGVKVPITDNNPNAVINGFTVDNIGVGTYILEVENTETGCTGDEQVYLPDNIVRGSEIRLNLSSTAATRCDIPNGVAEVTSIDLSEDDGATFTLIGDITDYNYQWYVGDDTTTPVPGTNPTATASRLENVEPGMYTVEATNINSTCVSVAYTVEVENTTQNNLDFAFNPTTQADCVNPDGALSISGITGGTGPFSYQWYRGGDDTYPITGATTNTISSIRSDRYMIRITDQATGCFKDSIYVLVPDQNITPVPPAVLTTPPTPSTTCDPASYNGEIQAEVDAAVRALANFSSHLDNDFFYFWFEGEHVKYINPSASPLDEINNLDIMTATPTQANNQSTISGLAPGFYTVIVVDAYDFNRGPNPLGCRSAPRTFEVVAEAQSPLASAIITPDTFCSADNGQVEATIEKRATDGTAFTGFSLVSATLNSNPFAPITTSNNVGSQTQFTFGQLAAGEYSFTFEDNTTTCDTTIFVEVNDLSVAPTLTNDNIQINSHQTTCNPPDGALEVIASATTGVTSLADYTFHWHSIPVTVSADINDAGAATHLGTGTILTGLESGFYYVYAINNTTGCFSGPLMGEILYQATETQVEITQNVSNDDCSGLAEGIITVQAFELAQDATTSTPGGGYNFNWYDDSNALIHTDNGTLASTVNNLPSGAYRVEVRNIDLDCETVTAHDTIRLEPIYPEFTAASASKRNVYTCDGDGEITITEVLEDGTVIQSTDAAFVNYEFTWHLGSTSSAALPGTTNVQTGLSIGTYYVRITNNDTGGCQSEDFLQVVLTDSIRYPVIYPQSITDFISCTGINEGEIDIRVEELDGSIASNYDFSWEFADGTPLPGTEVITSTGVNSEVISNLEAGNYRVIVNNDDTGCSQTATFEIGTQIAIPVLTVNKLTDMTNCFPADGSAEITDLTFMGSSLPYSGYQFIWSDDNFTTELSAGTYGLDADSLAADSLPAGTYLVKAVGPGCESLPVQVIVEDSTSNLVAVLDNISDPIIACDPADDAEGFIEVEVRNSTDIITRWYEGAVISNPTDSLVGFSNLLEVEDLIPGTYTIWIQDTLTGCTTTRNYTIDGIAMPLIISASSSPFSSCILPNGQVAANVNGGSGNYVYRWLDSDGNALAVSDDRNLVTELESGTYRVQVSDRNEPECETVETTVTVDDLRGNDIAVEVTNEFNMTNCDDENPNGQLSASVMGNPSRYEFFWYEGEDVSDNPIAQGSTAAELAPNTYSVVVRDRITGCLSDPVSGAVLAENTDYRLPTPNAEMLAAVTNCVIPNGSAIAVLDSTSLDSTAVYEYTWYNEDGDEVFRSTNTNTITGLAAEEYSVSVVNLVTGCYSEPTMVDITEDIRVPDFEIVSTPSTCFEASGTITVRFNENVKVVDIEWLTPNGYVNGFFLTNQPPGVYEATIIDDQGCTFTQTGEIESTIYTFNGISPNGDGNNDIFVISCIENFENNIVRIYNRAGTLVYENQNYDNETSYFEGYGNKGLYIAGDELPDGTYFYIIDKNNGDEPESGYLELMR